MDQKKIGKYIAEKRKNKGLTQAVLAEKLGVSDKAVSKWERGISLPDVSKYQELCSLLDITLNELFAGEDLDEADVISQSEENIISIVRFEKGRKRQRIYLVIVLAVAFLIACSWYISQNYKVPVDSTEHLGPLTYEMPGKGYAHAKSDVITSETGFGNDIAIDGKIYYNKKDDSKITVSEWTGQWHEFEPTVEYEKSANYDLKEYQGGKDNDRNPPDFLKSITVFWGEETEDNSPYLFYYKAYLEADMKKDLRQYVLTVKGSSFDDVRVKAESVISSMDYDWLLEAEFVRGGED